MPPLNESLPTSSLVKVMKKALPFVAVFIATFLFVGMQWPASSPGVRATVAVDFCLPTDITALSESETENFKTLLNNEISTHLTGQDFETLIKQTKRSGRVFSSAIEYSDQETISGNIALGFDFQHERGQLKIEYICEGQPDQLRFLQLVAHQAAKSIDRILLTTAGEIVVSENLDIEKFDIAMSMANQIQANLSQIRDTGISNHRRGMGASRNPYSLTSARTNSSNHFRSQAARNSEGDINSIDSNALVDVLNEIKTQATTRDTSDANFSVLKVDSVQSRAINATPDRWAMTGLLSLALVVTGLVAMFHAFPNRSANVDTLSQSLGIPVVAVLPTKLNANQIGNSEVLLSTAAKALIIVSKVFLITTAIVVIGFVTLDSSIRESFFHNPFDGMAKIFGIYFGSV